MAMAPEQQAGAQGRMADLLAQGQSVWLDYLTRDLVRKGGLRGMTSNPTIFQQASGEGDAYDDQIAALSRAGQDAAGVFEGLAIKDIQDAGDRFRALYDSTTGGDGYVSLEVSPRLARDPDGTIAAARRRWAAVDRPNLLIKIPGTAACAPAIETALSEGINVNVTVLFSLEHHERVRWKFIAALEQRAAAGPPLNRIASVASFFVSRVDTAVDEQIDAKLAGLDADSADAKRLQGLRGTIAIANTKLAYARFREIFDGARFAPLKAQGANVQRPLWARTGTKDKAYSDVRYVEELIGPDTVNTLPPATREAFQDHGTVARTIDTDVAAARQALVELKAAGIDIDAITKQLEEEGVASFAKSFDDLLDGVEGKRKALAGAAK